MTWNFNLGQKSTVPSLFGKNLLFRCLHSKYNDDDDAEVVLLPEVEEKSRVIETNSNEL